MPIDAEAKKILTGGAWASAPGALVQDPGSATPPVVRANGWGAPYSSTLVMEQETLQGLLLAQDSAIIETYLQGVPFYDDEIDYPQHALTNNEGVLYRAVVANGPGTSNVTTPGTNSGIWATVSGTQGRPDAPAQPMATSPNPGELYVTWNCPLDNGAEITSFDFRHRRAGQTVWPPPVSLTIPCHTLTGLTNGTAYEFQVRAVNSVDNSEWSAIGTGTPAATRPVGGSALALRGVAGDGEVDLSWLEPDDGGSAITGYTVQWKSGSQSFSSARQASVAAGTNTYTVDGLTNNTEYAFRVRASNSVGNSTWSNEEQVMPEALIPTGASIDFWGTSAPDGYLLEDGGEYSRTTYANLFAVIGTRFGDGNGSTTFNVPDSRRRVKVGAGGVGTTELGSDVGDTGGAETHRLTTDQMPSHSHNSGNLITDITGSHTHQQRTGLSSGGSQMPDNTPAQGNVLDLGRTGSAGSHSHNVTGSTGSAGSGNAHNIIQPSIVVTAIIKF